VPTGITFNSRLNAVSRMRVATMRLVSYGALAIVNVRVFPFASVSDGAGRVISIALTCLECPTGRFLETEGHRALGNLLAVCQP
jgi:hypothetical protein